jgi:hypothetical protein
VLRFYVQELPHHGGSVGGVGLHGGEGAKRLTRSGGCSLPQGRASPCRKASFGRGRVMLRERRRSHAH